MKRVRVVAAVVRRDGRILVTRRLPGGKVEPGESDRAALAREIREELGCEAAVGEELFRHDHDYPHVHVDLAFYACAMPPWGGAPYSKASSMCPNFCSISSPRSPSS